MKNVYLLDCYVVRHLLWSIDSQYDGINAKYHSLYVQYARLICIFIRITLYRIDGYASEHHASCYSVTYSTYLPYFHWAMLFCSFILQLFGLVWLFFLLFFRLYRRSFAVTVIPSWSTLCLSNRQWSTNTNTITSTFSKTAFDEPVRLHRAFLSPIWNVTRNMRSESVWMRRQLVSHKPHGYLHIYIYWCRQ